MSAEKTRRFVDLTPLRRSPAFARLWIGFGLSGIGAQMTIVAVGLQIFDITGDTLAVGLVGGIALIPMLIAGPWGGMLADTLDRRSVLLGAIVVAWLSTTGLFALSVIDTTLQAQGDRMTVWPFYVFTTISAVSYTIAGAARMSSYPRILPPELIPSATALGGIVMGVQLTTGPALAGVLVASVGFPITFSVDVVLMLAGFLGVITLPKLPPLHNAVSSGWEGVREGLRFLRGAPAIRASFLVDIIAMSFGRPFALLPAVAASVVGGGPVTVGALTAAAAVGTFATSLLSGPVGSVYRYGIAISRAVMVYGAFVAAFGVVVLGGPLGWWGSVGSEWSQANLLAVSLAALCFFGMGASDEVSAIFRSTMMLTAAPDDMRGRLQGVFFSVVAGGPRLGDLYTGIFATALALWAPPLFGGMLIVVLIAILMRVTPSFLNYDQRDLASG